MRRRAVAQTAAASAVANWHFKMPKKSNSSFLKGFFDSKYFGLAAWHYLALCFQFGIKVPNLAATLKFDINFCSPVCLLVSTVGCTGLVTILISQYLLMILFKPARLTYSTT